MIILRRNIGKWWKSRERRPLVTTWQCISLRGNHLRRKVAIVEAWIKATRALLCGNRLYSRVILRRGIIMHSDDSWLRAGEKTYV